MDDKISYKLNSGPYLDWKGNTIVSGQTVVTVRTKPTLVGAGFLFNGKFTKLRESEDLPKHVWQLCGEFKIKEIDEILYYTLEEEDYKISIQLSSLLWMNDDLICIKGVSDNEEDYYTEYFNTL